MPIEDPISNMPSVLAACGCTWEPRDRRKERAAGEFGAVCQQAGNDRAALHPRSDAGIAGNLRVRALTLR
jgi:hypothetical protein